MDDISIGGEARRGTLRFRLAAGMGLYPRLALFIILVTAGVSAGYRYSWLLGGFLLFNGALLVSVKGVSNMRKSPDTSNDRWVVGNTMDLRRIERKVRQGEELPANFMDGFTGWGFLTFLAAGAAAVALDYLFIPESVLLDHGPAIMAAQGFVLFFVFFTGTAGVWEPVNIMKKRELLLMARDRVVENWKNLRPVARPMLLLDEGDKENVTPEDVKLFVTFQDAPEQFIGVQAQITFNMSQPYLYCVILAKKDFGPVAAFKPQPASGITFERGTDKDVAFLVVRQTTTRNSGYTTSTEQAARVVDIAMATVEDILGAFGASALKSVIQARVEKDGR